MRESSSLCFTVLIGLPFKDDMSEAKRSTVETPRGFLLTMGFFTIGIHLLN
ncbi:hypothetical protein PVAP13_2KG036316 [Panicum virgatum]|uniref:Uncharacterized protein n=1 Tax=Panicum virgatum TaxID=38727 RepID=A0A8T0VXW9_PANVG|nr:hypothetical protein PVAP13_2KG036316 [Panicum virgatum]